VHQLVVPAGVDDPAAHAAYWTPAIGYLRAHMSPAYRAEAVDTAGHWPAYFLARARIPIARGWFRQEDFPQNRVLYAPFGPAIQLSPLGLSHSSTYTVVIHPALIQDRAGNPLGGDDGTLKLWSTASRRELLTLKGHSSRIRSVAFSPDGTKLATIDSQTLRVWHAPTDAEVAVETKAPGESH